MKKHVKGPISLIHIAPSLAIESLEGVSKPHPNGFTQWSFELFSLWQEANEKRPIEAAYS
ncbi:MAG TPA: hypothetical protein DD384_03185 [Firmicutes bacterium]|nr:hypothetical protein [Bacillota bacterium]